MNDISRRRGDNDDDTNEDGDADDADYGDGGDGDDGRYEFRLFAATTNFHENSRAVLLFPLPPSPPPSMKLVARRAVVSSSFEIAHISVPTEHPTVNFTLFAHSPTSVKIRYRTLFLRSFHAPLFRRQSVVSRDFGAEVL